LPDRTTTRGVDMSSEANEDASPSPARDVVDPAGVVAAMASAVEHVRQLATMVFTGDAALFRDPDLGPSSDDDTGWAREVDQTGTERDNPPLHT
jgi:hypothetical protein